MKTCFSLFRIALLYVFYVGLVWVCCFTLKGQETDLIHRTKYKSLFGHHSSISVYGGMLLETFRLKGSDEEALMIGGGGGFLIYKNKDIKKFDVQVFLGGFGLSSSSRFQAFLNVNTQYKVRYGGFLGGIILGSDWLVHPVIALKAGWGQLNISSSNFTRTDNFFAINPSMHLELNVTTWFRINCGIGYRVVSGLSGNFIANNLNANVGIYFGWFKT